MHPPENDTVVKFEKGTPKDAHFRSNVKSFVTDTQTDLKRYAPNLSMRGHKKRIINKNDIVWIIWGHAKLHLCQF